ncbi:MAG: hypothetical protein WBM98_12310 [Maribacter sp.]|uniref:hypothetical protein n=1 Tax=Maribacter sp. TaxID=1897614 RepID=UPI003C770850
MVVISCTLSGFKEVHINQTNTLLTDRGTTSFLKFGRAVQDVQVAKRTYKGSGFTIVIPENWKVKRLDDTRTMFVGPKIGNSHFAFFVTRIGREGKNYLDAAKATKGQQANYTNYTILEGKDISQEGFSAYSRRSSWFAEDIDMVLFVREIFTQSSSHVFILSASIPNTPHMTDLDKLAVSILNSFRFDQE